MPRAPKPFRSLAAPADAAYNPRTITDQALDGLAYSLFVYGDLSGIVLNRRTGNLVCGHQRRRVLVRGKLPPIAWQKPVTIELGHPGAGFRSTERYGTLTDERGAPFLVRQVDWPEEFEREANVVANNPHIQGGWDYTALQPILAAIQAANAPAAQALRLDALADDLAAALGMFYADGAPPPDLPSGDRAPIQQMTFTVSDDQADIIKAALAKARGRGPFVDTGNENGNGNALARVAEAYLG